MTLVFLKRLVAFVTLNAFLLLLIPPSGLASWLVFGVLNGMAVFLVLSGGLIPRGRSQHFFAYALTSVVMVTVAVQFLITGLVLLIRPLEEWASGSLPVSLGVEIVLVGVMLWAALSIAQAGHAVAETVESDTSARAFHRRAELTAENIALSAASPALKKKAERVQEEILYSPVAIDKAAFPLEASILNSLEMAATAMRAGDEATAERYLDVCSGYLSERSQRLRFAP